MEAGRTAVLRVKRKRNAEPAEALVLACKRLRSGEVQSSAQETPEGPETAAESNVFRLVATVRSQVGGGGGLRKGALNAAPAVILFLSPLRRSPSSSLCGLPCARPGAASCVSAATFAPLFVRSVKRAATG